MSPASILATLGKLSKVLLPARLTTFIHEQAEAFGKAVLVLRGGRYFIQSRRPETRARPNPGPGRGGGSCHAKEPVKVPPGQLSVVSACHHGKVSGS